MTARAICMAAALVLAACSGSDDTGPRIDQLAPSEAAAGADVDVLGVRFCGDDPANVQTDGRCAAPPAGFVTFGTAAGVGMDAGSAARGTVKMWTDTRITVTVPAVDSGVSSVTVTVDGVPSNVRNFNVL